MRERVVDSAILWVFRIDGAAVPARLRPLVESKGGNSAGEEAVQLVSDGRCSLCGCASDGGSVYGSLGLQEAREIR